MAIEKLYLTDTFRVWAEKFNATIDASNTATANAEKAINKAEEALQKAEQAVNDSVKGDNITTIVNEKRQVVVKDVAIDGDTNDLASKRGQIGDCSYVIVTSTSDFNNYLTSGMYGLTWTSENIPLNAPPCNNCILVVIIDAKKEHLKQIAYRVGTPNTNDHNIFSRSYTKTGGWSEWFYLITSKNIANNSSAGIVQIDGTTITIQDGIISAKTLGTLDGTTVVNNDFNNLTTAGRYFISTVKDTTANAPINVTADWWIDVFTYGEGSTKKIIQEARMHSTTSSSATSGVANYLARCCTGTTWGPWEYAYTQFAG